VEELNWHQVQTPWTQYARDQYGQVQLSYCSTSQRSITTRREVPENTVKQKP